MDQYRSLASILCFTGLFMLFSLETQAGTCSATSTSSCGSIIIDNTPNTGAGISTNLRTVFGDKPSTAIEKGTGGNAINIDAPQVMQRVNGIDLTDAIGVENTTSVSDSNFGTSSQLTQFSDVSGHLFDLNRLRAAANWMRNPTVIGTTLVANNIAPTLSHPLGTYGTITWLEFLDNIKSARTMYGVVRILVPLELKVGSGTVRNALGATVSANTIYGFCTGSGAGWCRADPKTPTTTTTYVTAPDDDKNNKIEPGLTVSEVILGSTTASTSQIRVKGSLMFDFVSNTADSVSGASGTPIALANLPYAPRDIYFKIILPINVNAANDANQDGVLDNIDYIAGLTSSISIGGGACPALPCNVAITTPAYATIDPTKVPQESIDAYNYAYGTSYANNADTAFQTLFNSTAFGQANRYHMLMASGYAKGWFDAFTELGITASQWAARGFGVPVPVSASVLSLNDIRSKFFEDIPVYMYTGGLIDMHHHVNVSGLVYVPQGVELEQKKPTSRQYIMGGLIVRDSFYIEAEAGGITVIASDPQSISNIKVFSSAVSGVSLSDASNTDSSGGASPSSICFGCSDEAGGNNGLAGGSSSNPGGTVRWVEIKPQ